MRDLNEPVSQVCSGEGASVGGHRAQVQAHYPYSPESVYFSHLFFSTFPSGFRIEVMALLRKPGKYDFSRNGLGRL